MRSMGAAATMAATAAALVVMVWTQRTHTLQDSWRPVPGLDLDFTFGAGEAGAGARGFASRVMGGISQGNGGGLVDAEARLGASEANAPPSAPTKFYLYDEIYALFEPVVACATRADEHAHLGDLDALRVNAELEFYKSLKTHPWRVNRPCDATVFVVPALPHTERSLKPGCAPENFAIEELHEKVLAVLAKSKYFAANLGRDHMLFSAETDPKVAPGGGGGKKAALGLGEDGALRNVVTAAPGLGLVDSADSVLSAPSAALGGTLAGGQGFDLSVVKDIDVVVVPLRADDFEMKRVVTMAARLASVAVVETASDGGTSERKNSRVLLSDPRDAMFPQGVKPQYYVIKEIQTPKPRVFNAAKSDEALAKALRDAAVVRAAATPVVSNQRQLEINAAKAARALPASLGAQSVVVETRKLMPGRWGQAPGLQVSLAALGDGRPTESRLDLASRRAHDWWAKHFDSVGTASLGKASSKMRSTEDSVRLTDAADAFKRGNYCVLARPRAGGAFHGASLDAAVASAAASAVAAECVPVLVADVYPTLFARHAQWPTFVILVPHKFWEADAGKVLRVLRKVYGDPRDGSSAGSRKLAALRASAPDVLWHHPHSRVLKHLLESVAERSKTKLAAVAKTGKAETGKAACDESASAPTLALSELGAAASSARRAGLEGVAFGGEKSGRRKSRRSKLGSDDTESLLAELVSDTKHASLPEIASNDPTSLIDELTTPSAKQPKTEAFDLPADATLVEAPVPAGGSLEVPERTFQLPDDQVVEVGGSVEVPEEETIGIGSAPVPVPETETTTAAVGTAAYAAVQVGGSIPVLKKKARGRGDENTELDIEAAAALADMEGEEFETPEEDEVEEPEMEEPEVEDPESTTVTEEESESTTPEPESTTVPTEDDLFEPAAAELTRTSPTETPQSRPVAETPEKRSGGVEETPGVVSVEESPGIDQFEETSGVLYDTANADDTFANAIADALHADSGERESRVAARSVAKELKKVNTFPQKAPAVKGSENRHSVLLYAPEMGDSESSEERLAERVAELLRPSITNTNAGGFGGGGGGAPLVSINVNTNTGGVAPDLARAETPSVTQTVPETDASTSTALYQRLLRALSAKSGEGEATPALREAAKHFVDELAAAVGDNKKIKDPVSKPVAKQPDADVEPLPSDRAGAHVTETAQAVGLDDTLDRAATRSAVNPSDAGAANDGDRGDWTDARLPAWARGKAGEDATREDQESLKLRPQTSRKDTSENKPKKSKDDDDHFWDEVSEALVHTTPGDEHVLKPKPKKKKRTKREEMQELPDARQDFLAREKAGRASKKDRQTSKTGKSRIGSGMQDDPLDEDPDAREMAGIDGVIRTAEAMSKVWASTPKIKVGDTRDAPADVAKDTEVVDAHVKLNPS